MILVLIEKAVDTISMGGRAGVLVSEALCKLQQEPDPSVQGFVWSQLRTHTELCFQLRSGKAMAREEVMTLELAHVPDGCTVIASERLRLWALQTTKEVWSSMPEDGRLALEAIGRVGSRGLRQSTLATAVGVTPNKLFYSVRRAPHEQAAPSFAAF